MSDGKYDFKDKRDRMSDAYYKHPKRKYRKTYEQDDDQPSLLIQEESNGKTTTIPSKKSE